MSGEFLGDEAINSYTLLKTPLHPIFRQRAYDVFATATNLHAVRLSRHHAEGIGRAWDMRKAQRRITTFRLKEPGGAIDAAVHRELGCTFTQVEHS